MSLIKDILFHSHGIQKVERLKQTSLGVPKQQRTLQLPVDRKASGGEGL